MTHRIEPPEAVTVTDRSRPRLTSGVGVARAHGVFNVVGGLWPLLHRRSFEAVFGPKNDHWLQYTVAGLLAGNGVAQILASFSPVGVADARRIGVITATWLLAIDLKYVPKGDIPKTYLLDAAMEVGWLAAWSGPGLRARLQS
ncbi:hypothetical protein IFM12275_03380 [Nocardia sputorum]|uniref:hypothetical protein n=1 Tax=Nocardia TaxID=1817 RepID=UPI00248F4F17|nr:hypothetical protein [Nocardia sputorum]BDT90362.1 hypothetical protein IFM12275_03380 [Nocardia sputorum]